jgi:mobilome CxxCx(11)CxxC protein
MCYGTAYIFEKRARPIRLATRLIVFAGIAGPVLIGAVVSTYGGTSAVAKISLAAVSVVGIVQLVLSVWSLVATWDTSLSYYIESKCDNYRLAGEFDRLLKNTTLSQAEFASQLAVLRLQKEHRSSLDLRYDASDKEKRMGMRAGLWKFQRACVSCKAVPTSLAPTTCNVCGDF